MNITTILTAITSFATLIMAIFYFVSISMQMYQMRIAYLPALGFDQLFLIQHKNGSLQISNSSSSNSPISTNPSGEIFMNLFNLGGGSAQNILIKVYKNTEEKIEERYINLLPAKESYQMPINGAIYEILYQAVINGKYNNKLSIVMEYRQAFRKKRKQISYDVQINNFNVLKDKNVYEVQFISKTDKKYL